MLGKYSLYLVCTNQKPHSTINPSNASIPRWTNMRTLNTSKPPRRRHLYPIWPHWLRSLSDITVYCSLLTTTDIMAFNPIFVVIIGALLSIVYKISARPKLFGWLCCHLVRLYEQVQACACCHAIIFLYQSWMQGGETVESARCAFRCPSLDWLNCRAIVL